MENKFNQVRKCIFAKDRNTNDTVEKVEVGYKVIIKRILNLSSTILRARPSDIDWCKKVSLQIYRIEGRSEATEGNERRGGISKRKGIKKGGITEVTKFLQRLSFVPISLFPLLFFAKFPTVGTSSPLLLHGILP